MALTKCARQGIGDSSAKSINSREGGGSAPREKDRNRLIAGAQFQACERIQNGRTDPAWIDRLALQRELGCDDGNIAQREDIERRNIDGRAAYLSCVLRSADHRRANSM